MSELTSKYVRETKANMINIVLPGDTNHHNTLFGGQLMAYIDKVATISAMRLSRHQVVTASTDSVDFLTPVRLGDSVCLESFVCSTGKTSMEVFVKVVTENLITGDRKVCATSFLTFVALDDDGKPTQVPTVIPETDEEKKLFNTAFDRTEVRKNRREQSKRIAEMFGTERK